MIKYYKNQLKIHKDLFKLYKSYSFFESIYRILAIIISPVLLKFNPNFISLLSLSFGVSAFYLFMKNYLVFNIAILLFIFSFIFDFSDGLIARYQNTTSFFGRFIDGLFDIFTIGLLHILFIFVIIEQNNNLLYKIFYFVTILFLPIQHLILDRFSALARWCNEIGQENKIKPYFRNIHFRNATFIFLDLQHLCIWFLLISGFYDYYIIIKIYLIISFFASLFNIVLYIHLAKKNFSNHSNIEDNLN